MVKIPKMITLYTKKGLCSYTNPFLTSSTLSIINVMYNLLTNSIDYYINI